MPKETFTEDQLAGLAKKYREASGKTRAQAARDLSVSRISVIHAEDHPEKSLSKLRVRMIEVYGKRRVVGPRFWLESTVDE